MWLLFLALAASAGVSSSDEIRLTPLEVRGTPSDLLQDDSIVPVLEQSTSGNRSEGSIQQEISEAAGLPVSDYGTPGGLSQFRGLGRSASEMDVHTLGVPLSPPQGAGFDFSVFPQFLWGGFRYRGLSAAGARDPRATGGSLTLIPWTYDALEEGRAQLRISQLLTTPGLSQTALGASYGNAALNFGYSDGLARGPSGSVGALFRSPEGRTSVHVHALMTDIQAESPGSTVFPTPGAFQRTSRIIPFVQADTGLGAESVLKQSVFFDRSRYRYEDPGTDYLSRVDTMQWGVDSVLVSGDWRAGVLFRRIDYESTDSFSALKAPAENTGRLELGRGLEMGKWTADGSITLTGVSRFGFQPGAGLGFRRSLSARQALFLRVRADRRVPTHNDRFFDLPGMFESNPGLMPEEIWSGLIGWERKGPMGSAELSLEAQRVTDAMILSEAAPFVSTVRNRGDAWRAALRGRFARRVSEKFRLRASATLARSRIAALGTPYPYLPGAFGAIGLESALGSAWTADLTGRFSGRLPDASERGLAGYGWIGLGVFGRLLAWKSHSGGLDFAMRLENLLDKRIELVRGYPLQGRSISVSLMGTY